MSLLLGNTESNYFDNEDWDNWDIKAVYLLFYHFKLTNFKLCLKSMLVLSFFKVNSTWFDILLYNAINVQGRTMTFTDIYLISIHTVAMLESKDFG